MLQIHVIRETLDTVAVEIHGAAILTRAGTAGILIGILGVIHVTRESRVVRVNRKIVDRMLVITEPREVRVGTTVVRVEMTAARHTVIVVLVVTTVALAETTAARHSVTVALVETTEARVGMTEDRAEMTVALDETTEDRVETTVALVGMTAARDETTEARAEMTVAHVGMIEARAEMTEVLDEVIHVDVVTARDVVAPMILAGMTEVRE